MDLVLTKVKVVLVEGVSKKTGKQYVMLKLETGDAIIDSVLKPVFLNNYAVVEELKKRELNK